MSEIDEELREIIEKVKDFGIQITRNPKYPFTYERNILSVDRALIAIKAWIDKNYVRRKG